MTERFLAFAATGLLALFVAGNVTADEVVRIADVPRERYQELHDMGDFWSVDSKTGEVIMLVDERQREAIEALGYPIRLDDERMRSLDYARSIDAEAWRQSGLRGIPGFPCYRTVNETKADLSAMASARPDLARWESIGDSWLEANGQPGGDDLYALALGNQNSPHDQAPFVLMAAQHARELTTAETATRFAEWLFDNYDTDPTARWLLDHREIHIIAQQNPDGRREVEDGTGMWRKNSNLDACPASSWTGVDLNRNSDYFWGDFSQGSTCEQTYRGTGESSEPETAAVQQYMNQVFERHRPGSPDNVPTEPAPDDADGLFISLHSFSELILFPWEGSGAGTANEAPNHDQLAWLGRKFGFFTGYEVGRDILYSAGGTMTDYAHGEFGVAAYTYEIGTTFQQACNDFENDIWGDMLDALTYAAKSAARPYQAPSGPDVLDPRAVYNSQTSELQVTGVVDGSRYDRNGVSEGPANDPVFDIADIRASFDLPPDQAASSYAIAPASNEPVTAFDALLEPQQTIDLPRLLFFQATDSEGNVGVPEAVWIFEQRAAVTPSAMSTTLMEGATGQESLTIANIGSESLNWSVEADLAAVVVQGTHDPLLDETLQLPDFSLPGAGSASAIADAGIDSRGRVVGFSFEGTVSNLGSNAWASDTAMTITAPNSESFTVGGYQTSNPDWDFQGSGSDTPGTYTSTHIGTNVFGDEGAFDEGQWTFDFQDTWEGGMDWADVTVTLHKQEPPACMDPAGVPWLSLSANNGSLAPGEELGIDVTIDAAGLVEGEYQALLCVSTDDPSAELIQVDVALQVVSGDPEIFDDRFESALR